MGRIVNTVIVDLTKPVEQTGFRSCAIVDTTGEYTLAKITDTKTLVADSELEKAASAYFANGGTEVYVVGGDVDS